MEDSTNEFSKQMREKDCERLAVTLSGENFDKILGIVKLTDGTGYQQSESVSRLLNEWNVAETVVAMSFDTTASNTGFQTS
jgi:hypothetical protein